MTLNTLYRSLGVDKGKGVRSLSLGLAALCLVGCAAWQPVFDPSELSPETAAPDPFTVRTPLEGLRMARALRVVTEVAANNRRDATFYASEVAFYGTLLAGIGVSTDSIAVRNTGGGALLATLVPGRYQLPKQREAFSKAAEAAACVEQKLVDAGVWDEKDLTSYEHMNGGRKFAVVGTESATPLRAAHMNLLRARVGAKTDRESQDKAQDDAHRAGRSFVVDLSIQADENRASAALERFEKDQATIVPATAEALRTIARNLQKALDAVELTGLTRSQVVQLIKSAEEEKDEGANSAREVAETQDPGEGAAQTAATAGAVASFKSEAILCASQ